MRSLHFLYISRLSFCYVPHDLFSLNLIKINYDLIDNILLEMLFN